MKKGGCGKVSVKCKIGVDLLMRILKQIGITKEEWLRNDTSHFTPHASHFTPYASRLTLYAHEPNRRDMSNVEARPLSYNLNAQIITSFG